ncbi:unnamed protein product [Orchesella dallaii]|uniref:Uncharacterized protein n=1 Tax=Orchesella dallaii TaxID=48710 RepID=A0ABP1RDT5_9HEXA
MDSRKVLTRIKTEMDVSKNLSQLMSTRLEEHITKKVTCKIGIGDGRECPSSSSSSKSKVTTHKSKVNMSKVDSNETGNKNSEVQLKINEANRNLHYLTQLFEKKSSFNKTELKEIINIMYKSNIDIYETLELTQDTYKKVNAVIAQLYKSKCEKNSVVSEEDMKIRYCFTIMNVLIIADSAECHHNSLKSAKKGAEMYPDDPYCHSLVSFAFNELRYHEEGLRYTEQSLEKFPGHPKLLYLKALHLENLFGPKDEEIEKRVEAFNEYIQALPHDHFRVPETCYSIAFCYMSIVSTEQGIKLKVQEQEREITAVVEQILLNFKRGCIAEKEVHPYFQSRLEYHLKSVLHNFLQNCVGVNLCTTFVEIETETDFSKILPKKNSTTQLQEEKIVKEKVESETHESSNCKCPSSKTKRSKTKVLNQNLKASNNTRSNSNPNQVDPNLENNENDIELRISEAKHDLQYLSRLFKKKTRLNKTEVKEIVNILYKSYIDVHDTLELPKETCKNVHGVITQLFKSKKEYEKNRVVGEEDMKSRFFFTLMKLHDAQSKIGLHNYMKLAKKGTKMYPHNPHYHCLVSYGYNQLKDHEGGLRYVEKALKNFPKQVALLISKVEYLDKVLGQTEEDVERRVKAYHEYIQALPKGHYKIPEFYYRIALIYKAGLSTQTNEEVSSKVREIIKDYFSRGVEAEKQVHSHFQSRLQSHEKLELKVFLNTGGTADELKELVPMAISEDQRGTETDGVSIEKIEIENEAESNEPNAQDSQETEAEETEGSSTLDEPSQLPPIKLELIKISNLLRNFQKLGINNTEHKPACKTEMAVDESVAVYSSTSTPEASAVIEPIEPSELSKMDELIIPSLSETQLLGFVSSENESRAMGEFEPEWQIGIRSGVVAAPEKSTYRSTSDSFPEDGEREKTIIKPLQLSEFEVAAHQFEAQPAKRHKIDLSSKNRKMPTAVSSGTVPKEFPKSVVITKSAAKNEFKSSHDAPSTNQPNRLPPYNPAKSDKIAISSQAPVQQSLEKNFRLSALLELTRTELELERFRYNRPCCNGNSISTYGTMASILATMPVSPETVQHQPKTKQLQFK